MLKKLIALQIFALSFSVASSAMEEQKGDRMNKSCQRSEPEGTRKRLPRKYSQGPRKTALAIIEKAKEELENGSPSSAMEGQKGDRLNKSCQRSEPEGTRKRLPLEYYQDLHKEAQAGSKEAIKELENNSPYITQAGNPMLDSVELGGSPEANKAIRAILAQWVPEEEKMYQDCQRLRPKFLHSPQALEYFQQLEKVALAGLKNAQEELESNSTYLRIARAPMLDIVIWGGTPEANEAIRAIFARWVPKED